jgi:hypothetical protein
MNIESKGRATSLGAAFVLALSALAALPGWAQAQEPKAKSAQLLSALAALEAQEKGLPAELKPDASTGRDDRAKAAAAFRRAGIACHDIMRSYAEPLGKKADRYLRASLAYEESPLARVYLGSSHMIQARDSANVITKIAEVDAGLKETDAAVKAAPDDILVRAVRVECTIELPSMFKRLDVVSKDLEFMLKAYAKDPAGFSKVYPAARAFELKAAELKQRGKNAMAEKYLEKSRELAKSEPKAKADAGSGL